MGSDRFYAVVLVTVAIVLAAGCTAGDRQVTPGGISIPLSGNLQNPATPGSDLTNQNSELAATFVNSASHTPLQPEKQPAALSLVAKGFSAPMMITGADDSSGRMFVVDQTGVVRIIGPDGTVNPVPFLDIRDRMVPLAGSYDERGLLSIAFHPAFRDNGRLFAYYSAPLRSGGPEGWSCTNHLSEFHVSASNPDTVDAATEKILLAVDKPYENHNGGTILFGPDDGYIYLPLGDGGNADDVGMGHTPGTGNAQDLTTLLGKIIRIDVNNSSAGKAYSIPADNPFVGNSGALPEIFAYGFRNPAYASFDTGDSHHLFVANAGQALFESVYIVLRGGDYGWNIREGTHCFDPGSDTNPPAGPCPVKGLRGEPLIGPVTELGHDVGNTVIGGAVYRGTALNGWQGRYVFGTWSQGFGPAGDGTLLVATPPAGFDVGSLPERSADLIPGQNKMWTIREISVARTPDGRINAFVRAISAGPDHELYVVVSRSLGPDPQGMSGEIWKIVPA